MNSSRISMITYALYLAVMSGMLLFYPALFLLLGFKSVPQPWVAICGYLVGVLAFLYAMAAYAHRREFYRWTLWGRSPFILFTTLLVVMGAAPAVLILLGLVDLLGALWTGWCLRGEDGDHGCADSAN